MSDFNPMDRARVQVHRSSFDLSQKRLFTAKVGELIPCYWQIAIPGTKYQIKSDWFTRTVPVNTAAYTRIKEYYDFFAVPLRLISRALPQAFTQMSDYATSAASTAANTSALTKVPYSRLQDISSLMQVQVGLDTTDDVGLPWIYGASKILNYLDYGAFLSNSNPLAATIAQAFLGVNPSTSADNPLIYNQSYDVNMLPLLTYQKIYYDFFSNNQWEKHLAYSYNVDYWNGASPLSLSAEMFELRYANYPKDYFLGVLPNSQYGNVATLPGLNPDWSPNRVAAASDPSLGPSSLRSSLGVSADSSNVTVTTPVNSGRSVLLNSDLSALSIRATEYLQRWKEVVQFASKDYSDQMQAQFGIKAPEYMGNHCHYIGGWSEVININEVVNTNLDAADSQASIAGKGVSSSSGHQLTYDCGAEHCVIMAIYHAVPLLDWSLTGQSPQLLTTSITDFPQPAFDQLGMQPVPAATLTNDYSRPPVGNLGYNLRYWQWKSNIDRTCGGFMRDALYKSWAAPLNGYDVLSSSGTITYQSFKVRPQQLNTIFQPQVSGSNCSVAYDQLLCNVNFQVYAVQNLDRNGLPY
uniref:Major capsid protein n=1 Tax=Dulem virus 243 TaxID=3145720 RepID=A0AAU8B9F8_9VIRU